MFIAELSTIVLQSVEIPSIPPPYVKFIKVSSCEVGGAVALFKILNNGNNHIVIREASIPNSIGQNLELVCDQEGLWINLERKSNTFSFIRKLCNSGIEKYRIEWE